MRESMPYYTDVDWLAGKTHTRPTLVSSPSAGGTGTFLSQVLETNGANWMLRRMDFSTEHNRQSPQNPLSGYHLRWACADVSLVRWALPLTFCISCYCSVFSAFVLLPVVTHPPPLVYYLLTWRRAFRIPVSLILHITFHKPLSRTLNNSKGSSPPYSFRAHLSSWSIHVVLASVPHSERTVGVGMCCRMAHCPCPKPVRMS